MDSTADVAVIGGTGLYALLPGGVPYDVETPYGTPSSRISVHEIGNQRVAFLARHGQRHELPAHRVPYRANMWALASIGVTRVLAPCAVGSLRDDIAPGSFVVPDQIIDRTHGRDGTFFDEAAVHVAFADPYCAQLRSSVAAQMAPSPGNGRLHGTVVVVSGPRFGTRAEASWHRRSGGDLVNMTAMPEAALARELTMCYCNIAVVTDFDAGVDGGQAVNQQEVIARFATSLNTLHELLMSVITHLLPVRTCDCGVALDGLDAPALLQDRAVSGF